MFILSNQLIAAIFTLFAILGAGPEDKKQDEIVKWDNRLEFSFIQTSGNTENSTFAGKYSAKGIIHKNRVFVHADMLAQSKDGEESANKSNLKARYEREFADKIFLLFETKYERDRFSGYEYRLTGGPGVGYDVFAEKKFQLKTYGSMVYHYDMYSRGDLFLDSYMAVQFNVDTASQLQDNLKLSNDFNYVISTKEQEKYHFSNESAMSVKINSTMSLGLSYKVKYDNKPPSVNLKKVNSTFLSSLIFDF